MQEYSSAHERDENRLMNKAFGHSIAGLLLCWLPLVGLFFAISGFMRMMVRITEKHRAKRTLLLLFSIVVMMGSIGVLGYEIYEYSRNPSIVLKLTNDAWTALTGEQVPPWEDAAAPNEDMSEPEYGRGLDPYENDYDFNPYGDEDDGVDIPDQDYDYDADFDDAELAGFPEDDAADLPEKELFNQMMAEQRSPSANVLPQVNAD